MQSQDCDAVEQVTIPNTIVTSLPESNMAGGAHTCTHAHTDASACMTVPEWYVKPITHCPIYGTIGDKYQISFVKLWDALHSMSRGAVQYIKMLGK
jgi:hypothetical protein